MPSSIGTSDKQGLCFSISMSHTILFVCLFVLLNLATLTRHVFMIPLVQFLSRQQLFKAGRGHALTMPATRHNFLSFPLSLLKLVQVYL